MTAIVGVSDHAGWAVLVTVSRDGSLLDRRRVELVDSGLPVMPHHHDALKLPLPDGVELVARVRASAERHGRDCLAVLADAVPQKIAGIALRQRHPLPETVEERLTNYRAQNVADWVMYRDALAQAATARGWFVHWYEPKRVFAEAAAALDRTSIDPLLKKTGAMLGPPWQQDHKLAMAGAISAAAAIK
jgi:hypothetical protein